MRARELLLGVLLLSVATLAHGAQERPAFENTLSYRSFHYSEGSFVSPSELELIDGKFPTDEVVGVCGSAVCYGYRNASSKKEFADDNGKAVNSHYRAKVGACACH